MSSQKYHYAKKVFIFRILGLAKRTLAHYHKSYVVRNLKEKQDNPKITSQNKVSYDNNNDI